MQHEEELFELDTGREAERERIFDEVATELQRCDPDLSFELGPKQRRREVVISASGIKSAFPAVVSLVYAAPATKRWRVTAFRPRRTAADVVEFRGKRVHPKDVQFSLLDNGKIAGIYLFIPGYREDDSDLKQIGYLLLDEVIGEYDVETRMGPIKMFPPHALTDGERYPLADLPARFDALVALLERHSGKPS